MTSSEQKQKPQETPKGTVNQKFSSCYSSQSEVWLLPVHKALPDITGAWSPVTLKPALLSTPTLGVGDAKLASC